MEQVIRGKVSAGRVVLPAELRKEFGIEDGAEKLLISQMCREAPDDSFDKGAVEDEIRMLERHHLAGGGLERRFDFDHLAWPHVLSSKFVLVGVVPQLFEHACVVSRNSRVRQNCMARK